MRWLAATLALALASIGLAVGIYLRDRDPNAWHPPQPQLADKDALTLLAAIQGWHCHSGCRLTRLSETADHEWVARMLVRFDPLCAAFSTTSFSFIHGRLSGVRFVDCRNRAAAPPHPAPGADAGTTPVPSF